MKTIPERQVIFSMSRANPQVAMVRPAEFFAVHTQDCYSNAIRTTKDRFTREKWGLANPATGPIFIEGAEPPNLLAVIIHDIQTAPQGAMYINPDQGALGHHLSQAETRIFKIAHGRAMVDKGLEWPLRPMIGVIGTAPRGKAVPTVTPGEHGGNLDCKHITAGSVVYLPINVEGALLAMGDLHALMGDGEVAICALEVTGTITCSVEIVRPTVVTPAVQTAGKLMILGSAKSLDRAQRLVLDKTMTFLTQSVGVSAGDAVRLLSLVADLAVCQVVDPLKTMRVELPLRILRHYGWRPQVKPRSVSS